MAKANYLHPKCCEEPKWTRRTKSSITPWPLAKRMAKMVFQHFGQDHSTVLDMTACYGNETMACAKYFPKVISCEWNAWSRRQLEIMTQQFARSHPNAGRIQVFGGNSVNILEFYAAKYPEERTIILCDPPWPGGHYYMKTGLIKFDRFRISGKLVFNLAIRYPRCTWVVKLPKNFDLLQLCAIYFSSEVPDKRYSLKIWPQMHEGNLVFYYLIIYSN